MKQLDPERFITTPHEQYLDNPEAEWLGPVAIADVVELVKANVPNAQIVVVTFDGEDHE